MVEGGVGRAEDVDQGGTQLGRQNRTRLEDSLEKSIEDWGEFVDHQRME